MPDFWTHLIAGEEIASGIKDKKIRELLNDNYQLFNYGCQGADFFFYKDFWPWQKSKGGPEKGTQIHSLSGKRLFAELLPAYKKEEIYVHSKLNDSKFQQNNLVYLLGFISHYALDRECHPFIIRNGGKDKKHKLIEASIDIYIMEQKWNQNPTAKNPLPFYQLQEADFKTLNYFYQIIFNNFIQENLKEDLIWESYQDFRKYHKLFSTNINQKYYLFKFLNIFTSQDLSHHCYALNETAAVWPEENYKQFEKHFNRGIKSAQKLIGQTLKYFKTEISLTEVINLFGEKNFLGEA